MTSNKFCLNDLVYQTNRLGRAVQAITIFSLIIVTTINLSYPGSLFANELSQSQNVDLISQEIRYHLVNAGEVTLVWGINEWQLPPDEMYPPGTIAQDGVLFTPMVKEGDSFSVNIQAPANTILNYVFQITATKDGQAADDWDTNNDQDYQTVMTEAGLTEVHTKTSPGEYELVSQEFRYQISEASEVFLVWGVNDWQLVPENIRLENTTIVNSVLRTSMKRNEGDFVAHVQVPKGSRIDFGFLITKKLDGTDIGVWDEGDDQQDSYQIITKQDQVIEIPVSTTAIQALSLDEFDIEFRRFLLVSVGGLGVTLVVFLFRSWIVPNLKREAELTL